MNFINPFIIKKWAALLLSGLLTTIGFYIGLIMFNFMFALIFMGFALVICVLLGNMLLNNPFRAMLEGQGVLALNIDSTGIIKPFIMAVKSPYVEGRLDNKLASDVFDRETVLNLAAPQETGTLQQGTGKDGQARLAIVLSEEEYNRGRFALFHYPVIIYNEQINSIITKDFLSNEEKTAFAEHGVLYLNRKMEELTSAIRDFGRHVVETLKPRTGLNISPAWVMIIIIVFVVILLILFAPNIMQALGIAGQTTTGAVTTGAGAIQKVV